MMTVIMFIKINKINKVNRIKRKSRILDLQRNFYKLRVISLTFREDLNLHQGQEGKDLQKTREQSIRSQLHKLGSCLQPHRHHNHNQFLFQLSSLLSEEIFSNLQDFCLIHPNHNHNLNLNIIPLFHIQIHHNHHHHIYYLLSILFSIPFDHQFISIDLPQSSNTDQLSLKL